MMSPKVSLIVPVYNPGCYLTPCLESLAGQTMDELEIILVDDHGTDSSIDIARDFVGRYSGPKSFVLAETPANSGPGPARNIGISHATGEYIGFVDSDDTIDPEFCSLMYSAAKEADADMVCCDILICGKVKVNADVSDKRRFLRHFVSYFTTFIYRRSMIVDNGIVFPPTRSAEDSCFLSCCVLSSSKMSQVHKALYHYTDNTTSVSRRKNRLRGLDRIKSFRALGGYAKSHRLYAPYRRELLHIVLRKCYAMAVKDLLIG